MGEDIGDCMLRGEALLRGGLQQEGKVVDGRLSSERVGEGVWGGGGVGEDPADGDLRGFAGLHVL